MLRATPFESEEYWNSRYLDPVRRKAELFDWYGISFREIEDDVGPILRSEGLARTDATYLAIDVGCGNSPFLLHLAEYLRRTTESVSDSNGSAPAVMPPLKLVGTDFSEVVITQQCQRSTESLALPPGCISFVVADARESLSVPPCSTFAVIDKATLDAVDCSGVAEDAERVVLRSLESLVTGGYFISLTCRPPARRLDTIQSAARGHFDLEVVTVKALKNDPISPSQLIILRKKG